MITAEQQQIGRQFISAAWEFDHAISSPDFGLCNDGSCYRCRLTALLIETEELCNAEP